MALTFNKHVYGNCVDTYIIYIYSGWEDIRRITNMEPLMTVGNRSDLVNHNAHLSISAANHKHTLISAVNESLARSGHNYSP